MVYYKDKRDATSIINVLQYQLVEMYAISDRWYTIMLTTEEGKNIRIHSSYFIEMQKPSFIADMAAQE